MKDATPIGCGAMLDAVDRMALDEQVDLLRYEPDREHPVCKCTAAAMTDQIGQATGLNVWWPGEHDEFLLKCENLVKEWKRPMAPTRCIRPP